MFDWLADFFQGIYDSTIGYILSLWSSFTTFISSAWDIILILAIVAMAFVVFKMLRYLTVPAIILGQIAMLTALITAMLAFVALLATSLVAIYNRIFSLAEYIASAPGASCLGYGIDCLGISGVLGAFFTELFALFIVVLVLRVSGLFLYAMNIISDKVWRIGVLLGSM